MKKFRIFYLIFLIIISVYQFVPIRKTDAYASKITLYFVDRQMLRLIPWESYITSSNPDMQARLVLEKLITGKDYNDSIRRILPDNPKSLTVRVKDKDAVVNINTEYFSHIERSRIHEQLIVYQLVNSLCTVEGVLRVKFTIDGEESRNFFGFMDMREAFVPDYMI